MNFIEIVPKSFPNNLIKKDWEKRKCVTRFADKEFCDLIHEVEVFEDDVWIVTPPKCGTTWMQELVWLILNDYNFEVAKAKHLEWRSPFLEFDYMLHKDLSCSLKPIQELQSPRLVKSHLPLPLLPKQLWQKKAKVIYVYRNPKDAWVSAYYHGLGRGLNLDKTVEQFVVERLATLQQQFSFEDVTEFYQLRNEPWMYYTSFERMKQNLSQVISDICKFLNKSITDEQMQQMLHHLSFEEMKKNPATNNTWGMGLLNEKYNTKSHPQYNFIRKGKVNGYKDELSPEIIQKADHFIESELSYYNLSLNELLLLN